jgi:hypothetical protein
VKILNESAFNKIIFLLICTALMVTCIGSAAASSSATQEQSGQVSVTGGEVDYDLTQEQSAEVIDGDGEITQAQQSSVNVVDNGKVEIVTVRMSESQSVDTASTVGSTNNKNSKATPIDSTNNKNSKATPKSNVVETITTDDSGSIDLTQTQTETSDGDIDQEQTAFLKIISTPNDKVHAIIHLKQK